jgi:hypothetical protein
LKAITIGALFAYKGVEAGAHVTEVTAASATGTALTLSPMPAVKVGAVEIGADV